MYILHLLILSKMESININYLLTIPHELLSLILDLLTISPIFSLSHVCRTLRNICKNNIKQNKRTIIIDTITNGYTNLFIWLNPNTDIPSKFDYCKIAASCGSLDILKHIWNISISWQTNINSGDIMGDAAGYGHLEIVKWLYKNGCYWNTLVCYRAAYGGHLEVLKYLHDNGCPWNEYACAHAAESGQLEILKYLHNNGCLWTSWACARAAGNGHLECLQYMHENGCRVDSWACAYAYDKNHHEVLKYLHDNNCPCTIVACRYCNDDK